MADITMCSGDGCSMKHECYRHTAPPSEYWQSMFVDPPLNEDGSCDMFWKNDDKPKRKQVY